MSTRQNLWNFFDAVYTNEINDTSPRSETPSWIKTPLLPHQQAVRAAALGLEAAKLSGIDVGPIAGDPHGGKFYASYGILGDRVGSGKSLTALSLVKEPAPASQYCEFITRGNRFGDERDVSLLRTKEHTTDRVGNVLRPVSTTLFVIPHALMNQWEGYVDRDTTLKALFIKRKNDATDEKFMETLESYDAVFVSATMWNTFRSAQPIHTLLWKRAFIDEADSVGISNDTDTTHALFYWFITASWINLLFAGGAYFNIGTYLTPPDGTSELLKERVLKLKGTGNYLAISGCRHLNLARAMCGIGSGTNYFSASAATFQSARLVLHSSDEFISKSFTPPVITHTNIICRTPNNIRVLDSLISNDMMEQLNAGDVGGVLDQLGMSAHSENEIAEAITANLKKELVQAKRTHEFKKGIEYSSEAAKQKAMESCEQKIASIESRIQAIEDRIKKAKEQTCPICYCEVSTPAVTPCCQQLFCFPCLCESLKRAAACPICRTRIESVQSIQVVGTPAVAGGAAAEPVEPEKLFKKEAVVDFVKKHPEGRILIFSSYDATFAGIEESLSAEHIRYATVNGSNARITKLLRESKEGKYTILFLNAKNLGAGLNIESATHVLLFHRMAPELEGQIIGRANRLGRTAPLEVIHLLHENEMGNVLVYNN